MLTPLLLWCVQLISLNDTETSPARSHRILSLLFCSISSNDSHSQSLCQLLGIHCKTSRFSEASRYHIVIVSSSPSNLSVIRLQGHSRPETRPPGRPPIPEWLAALHHLPLHSEACGLPQTDFALDLGCLGYDCHSSSDRSCSDALGYPSATDPP